MSELDSAGALKVIESITADFIDICPHCGAKSHIVRQWNSYHIFKNRDEEHYIIFRCKPCKKLLLKVFRFRQNPYVDKSRLEAVGWVEKFPITLNAEITEVDGEKIPQDAYVDYKEAMKCKSIGSNRASCAMFRRALQNCLLQLGADKKDTLHKQIHNLKNLPDDIKDWADEIRILGNWGAHPDEDMLKDVNADEVAQAHEFTSKFLIYMFIMPGKVKESREKRESMNKKGDNKST